MENAACVYAAAADAVLRRCRSGAAGFPTRGAHKTFPCFRRLNDKNQRILLCTDAEAHLSLLHPQKDFLAGLIVHRRAAPVRAAEKQHFHAGIVQHRIAVAVLNRVLRRRDFLVQFRQRPLPFLLQFRPFLIQRLCTDRQCSQQKKSERQCEQTDTFHVHEYFSFQ